MCHISEFFCNNATDPKTSLGPKVSPVNKICVLRNKKTDLFTFLENWNFKKYYDDLELQLRGVVFD